MDGYFPKIEAFGFEEVLMAHDAETGLKAIIAIHNTVNGPALGGTRMWNYSSEAAAFEDVLRLARGMTYKSAGAELPLGGGKAVIMGDPRRDKSGKLLMAYGRVVEKLQGRYITAQDMGIDESDLDWVRRETAHVLGGSTIGTPSPFTAYGVWQGIKASAEEVYSDSSLEGKVVAVQGLGGVGSSLCDYLAGEGARLIVTDIVPERVSEAVAKWGAKAVEPEEIYAQECHIFAPCGGGAVINKNTISRLSCRVVAGAANNVLEKPEDGEALARLGILYAPDYVINAGGLIFVDSCRRGCTDKVLIRESISGIGERLRRIFAMARERDLCTAVAADLLVEERISSGNRYAGV